MNKKEKKLIMIIIKGILYRFIDKDHKVKRKIESIDSRTRKIKIKLSNYLSQLNSKACN